MPDNNSEMPSHHGVGETTGNKYPNETIRLLHERSSCRSFHDKKIPNDLLKLVLEAGTHAPTGGNLQPYSIIKIEDKEVSQKLGKMCRQEFIGGAPVNLIFCIDWRRLERWADLEYAPFTATSSFRHFWISFQDTIIAAQNICTAADALDLGSVYIGTITEYFRELKDMFELPNGVFPVVLLCLGYPKVRPKPKKKLGLDIIVHDEKYHEYDDQKIKDSLRAKYPDLKIDITEERLEQIFNICKKVHCEKFAEKCIEVIKEQGYINPVQRYFGLHYTADTMPDSNDKFMKTMEDFGFNWFKKYVPNYSE